MTGALRKLLLALALLLALPAAAQAQYSRAAQHVLSVARAASGGAGWNQIRGWHETGRQGDVRYECWFDPLRYGMRVETREPAGLKVHGFNGQGDWFVWPNGTVDGTGAQGRVAAARTLAFFSANAFFYPGRFDAKGELVGVRSAGGQVFDVVRITPWGGEPRELWFDRRTHLLTRIVDRTGPKPVAIALSDYRKVGPVRVAFRSAVEGGGPAQVREVESLVFAPADRAMFSLPRPAAVAETAATPG